ncbi:MAG: hypothetical protein E3J83_01785 [Candidatus Atribacteria bacterium]|nr:MAG: hypothetical protein E3J83_01785 [Candidatus Atribacteria bacterium]
MKVIKVYLLAIVIILVLISGCISSSCVSERDQEFVKELMYIKQEFIDKSSETNITFVQKEQELKDIKRELIQTGKPDNEKLRDAYDKCLSGMDKIIMSAHWVIWIEESQERGAPQQDIKKNFDEATKLLQEGHQLFYEVDIILKDF